MERKVLVLDLIGLEKGPLTNEVSRMLRERLRDSSCKIYLLGSPFFQQAATLGQFTAAQVEGAFDEVEREIMIELSWREKLADFLIVLLAPPEDSSRLLVLLAMECVARSARLPLVLTVQVSEKKMRLVEAARLPLKFRCLEGESVVLACDVWLEGASAGNGDLPAFRRGTFLTVVERVVRGEGVAVGDSFLSVAAPDGQDILLSLVVPWSLALHPAARAIGMPPPEHCSAVAAFRLPCWYEVQIEQARDEQPG